MAEKRFYWIKLKTDFFNQEAIDFLMSQPNGCEYIVLYQMLCLQTANQEGFLHSEIGEMIIPYDAQKIARDTKYFEIDTIMVAMELFKKLGLIYAEENQSLRIANYDEMVGSETASAKRVRKHREKEKALQCNNKALQCNNNVTQEKEKEIDIEYRDKSIEIDIEKEIKTGSLEQLYLDNCSNLRPYIPNNYSSEVTALTKSITNGMLTFEDVERAFKMANESDFLSGKVNDWQADFRWMIKPQNIQKILDGNYENRAKKKQTEMYSHDYDVDDIEKRMLRR